MADVLFVRRFAFWSGVIAANGSALWISMRRTTTCRPRGIGYREAMGRIHAVAADGTVLQDVAVFREAYRLIGLGWLYAPTRWP